MSPLLLIAALAVAQAPEEDAPRIGVHATGVWTGGVGLAASYERGGFVARAEGLYFLPGSGAFASLTGGWRLFRLGERREGLSLALNGQLGAAAVFPTEAQSRLGPFGTVRLETAWALNPALALELGAGASVWVPLLAFGEGTGGTFSDAALLLGLSAGVVF